MITSRDFRRPAHHEFYKTLVEASPSGAQPFYRLFEHFLTMSSTALAQGVSKFATGKIDAELEAEYMRTVKQYDREKACKFAHAQAIMVNSLQEELHDFLGDVFTCSEISNHWNGQFFTPWPLCKAMAKITFGEVGAIDPNRRLTVCEPAVGGGAMLLAVAVELKEAGYNPWNWWFEATDNDLRCFQMAYIQLTLAGAAGVVRHGNSLTNQVWKVWPTLTGAMFPHRWPEEKKIIELPPPPKAGEQMKFNLAA